MFRQIWKGSYFCLFISFCSIVSVDVLNYNLYLRLSTRLTFQRKQNFCATCLNVCDMRFLFGLMGQGQYTWSTYYTIYAIRLYNYHLATLRWWKKNCTNQMVFDTTFSILMTLCDDIRTKINDERNGKKGVKRHTNIKYQIEHHTEIYADIVWNTCGISTHKLSWSVARAFHWWFNLPSNRNNFTAVVTKR